jgi:microcystin-dependent protein
MDEYIDVTKMFIRDFAPQGWLLCKGQELQLNNGQHQVLFALIGTQYDGDGVYTFK